MVVPRTHGWYRREFGIRDRDRRNRRRLSIAGPLLILAGFFVIFAATEASAACGDSPGPKVDWSKCHKEHMIIREQDFSNARLDDVHMNFSDLFGSNFSRASFRGAYLIRSRLAATKLIGANLSQATLIRANLADADLTDADLTRAELVSADMHGANLERAILRDTNISRVNFIGSKLAGADIRGAYTLLASFEGVDLSNIKGLSQNQLDIACGNEETILPVGYDRPDQWPCPEGDR